MLGYMNEEAFAKTQDTKLVTFFSRTKNRLWTKGEESGNVLNLVDIKLDCDNDTLLIQVNPNGPTCHTGTDTCWKETNTPNYGFFSIIYDVFPFNHKKRFAMFNILNCYRIKVTFSKRQIINCI